MNTLDFLKRVLPDSGYYCGGLVYNGKYSQRMLASLEDLSDFVRLANERGADTYFAVSSFKTGDNRKVENVEATKLLAFDIDVGKTTNSYHDQRSAMLALTGYLQKSGLPKPMIVASGMGFHVYWVLTDPVGPSVWQPVAQALKDAALLNGLIIDPKVTADAARILRPICTMHTKSGKEVKIILDAEPVSINYIIKKLPVATIQPRKTTILDNLAVRPESPPAIAGIIANKCKQVRQAINKPDAVSEPQWYSLMGVAAYTEEPEHTAIEWSRGHPQFSEAAAIAKMEQWKTNTTGPATCAGLESANPGGCHGCPFKGKITTPVKLGAQYEAAPPPVSADNIADKVPMPWPFKRTTDGIKITVDDTDLDVCPFDIYPVGYGKDEVLGYETVRYHWKRPHVGWTELKFRQAFLTEGHREFPTCIADQGIVLASKRQTDFFQMMLKNYMEELRKIKTLTNLYSSMGWKEDNTQFVIGDTILRRNPDGRTVEAEQSTLSNSIAKSGVDNFSCNGDLDSWINGTRILEAGRMPWHKFALGLGFAAPLFAFSGLKGLTISLYGPTGGGKSLIQYWIQSIYGDPDKLHFAAKFTQNSLFSRLGMYNNLPMTIDEATMFQDKEVGDFLYWVSQGRDKQRLTRSAEERDAKTWATPVIVSTNKSMQAKLLASGLETDAQMARLLEVSVPASPLFSKDSDAGQKIYSHLMSNYGHAGRVYLAELVRLGDTEIRKLIDEARAEFRVKYNAKFTGEERFWETAIILQDLGSKIADSLGLIRYNYETGTQWVLAQLGAIRKASLDNKADCFDFLAEYINDNADAAVTVTHTGSNKPFIDMSKLPRSDIHVRFDMYRNDPASPFDNGTLMVHRTHFRKWLSTHGGDYKAFMSDMTEADALHSTPSNKACLGKHTPIKLAQVYVIGFKLTHPRLSGMLNDAEDIKI